MDSQEPKIIPLPNSFFYQLPIPALLVSSKLQIKAINPSALKLFRSLTPPVSEGESLLILMDTRCSKFNGETLLTVNNRIFHIRQDKNQSSKHDQVVIFEEKTEQFKNWVALIRHRFESRLRHSTWVEVSECLGMEITKQSAQLSELDTESAISSTQAEFNSVLDEVGGLVARLSDISKQARLLSVNIAVEAARQGDDARGVFNSLSRGIQELSIKSSGLTGDMSEKLRKIGTQSENIFTVLNKSASQKQNAQPGEDISSLKINEAKGLLAGLKIPKDYASKLDSSTNTVSSFDCLDAATLMNSLLLQILGHHYGLSKLRSVLKSEIGEMKKQSVSDCLYRLQDFFKLWNQIFSPGLTSIIFDQYSDYSALYRYLFEGLKSMERWLIDYELRPEFIDSESVDAGEESIDIGEGDINRIAKQLHLACVRIQMLSPES